MADSLRDGGRSITELAGGVVRHSTSRTLAAAVSRPALAVLAMTAAATYLSLFLKTVRRIGDEGSIVYGAQRVVEGAVPYRDFFEVMGPGSFYWLALWFKLLGTSWLTSRLVVLATALASAWAIYHIASRHYTGRFAVFPAVFYTVVTIPLWPGANHHFDSNLWALLAIATVVSVPEVNARRGLVAGVLLGLSSTIMPQKGLLILAALGLSAALQARNRAGWRRALPPIVAMGLGFGAVGLVVIFSFWAQNALGELFYANVVWPATQYHSVNVSPYAYGLREWLMPAWGSVLHGILPVAPARAASAAVMVPLVFVAVLPVVAVVVVACRAVGARRHGITAHEMRWTYVLTGLALFASECHRPDIMHLIYGSPVLLVVVTGSLARTGALVAVIARRVLVSCLVVLAALLALIASKSDVQVDTRRGQVQMFEEDEALDFLQRNVVPGGLTFVYPYYPMYYFLADVRNPTRYSILMYHINTREQFEEVIGSLETERVRYALWDTLIAGDNLSRWFPAYRHPPQEEQILERYLDANYRVLAVKNGFKILERIDAVSQPAAQ